MKLLDLTLANAAQNLALDEALLEWRQQQGGAGELLRLWESPRTIVVVGRSSRIEQEVHRQKCRERQIPIFRRCSGGASVVIGTGCLAYTLALSYEKRPQCRMIDQAHRLVMTTLGTALDQCGLEVGFQGTCDLTWRNRKFCGNAMRCRQTHFLYHGTLLYDFPLNLIEELLAFPPRTPDYRSGRSHREFLCNLPVGADVLRQALVEAWGAEEDVKDWPQEQTRRLAEEKYSQSSWNERLV